MAFQGNLRQPFNPNVLDCILYIHYSFGLSTDAARRLIELGLFAFSPFLINAVPALSKGTHLNDFSFINLFF